MKRIVNLIVILFLLFSLSGCTESNAPEEKNILDSEIRFRDYEWYFSDEDKVHDDLVKAYDGFYIPPFDNPTPYIEADGVTIYRLRLEWNETSPYAGWGSIGYDKYEKVYLEGQQLKAIYVDFIRSYDYYLEKEYKLVSGAYIFEGGKRTFDNLKEYLSGKYGKPSRLKSRYVYKEDYFEYEFEESNVIYEYNGNAEYYEWYGQNNTVLELALYTRQRDKKEEVFVRYYVPDGYKEYNDFVRAYKQEQMEKKQEENNKNNGVL